MARRILQPKEELRGAFSVQANLNQVLSLPGVQ